MRPIGGSRRVVGGVARGSRGLVGIRVLGCPILGCGRCRLLRLGYGAGLVVAVDDDFDEVAFFDASDGSACEGFGSDVSDACAGGDAGETGVGD